jgi:hypothetical protein
MNDYQLLLCHTYRKITANLRKVSAPELRKCEVSHALNPPSDRNVLLVE